MLAIERGHFLPGGVVVAAFDKGVNETYRGTIEIGRERIDAYVKFLSVRQLSNELLASALGAMSGLNLPRAFLVVARLSDYPNSAVLRSAGRDIVAFATEAVGLGSLKRRIGIASPRAVEALLKSWEGWPDAASFDDWIANGDRNWGNILIGLPGEVWLIDHSHAFTGPSWTSYSLSSAVRTRNRICEAACACMKVSERVDAERKALGATRKFAKVDVDAAIQLSHVAKILPSADCSAVRAFVANRVHNVHDNVAAQLGVPVLTLGPSK